MIRHGAAPFLECSSAGDKRFSAFYAQVIYLSKVGSIEEHYQSAKLFADGSTGLNWRQAKGRRAVNHDSLRILYSHMWDVYILNDPHLQDVLMKASGLSDKFGTPGSVCQASELWRIKTTILPCST